MWGLLVLGGVLVGSVIYAANKADTTPPEEGKGFDPYTDEPYTG